jgi:hypothetical protein
MNSWSTLTAQSGKITNVLLVFELTLFSHSLRGGTLCTETTAVWFLGFEFKPTYRLLYDPREEFQSSLTSTCAGTQTLCYFCSSESSRGTFFTDIHQKFTSSLRRWRAPYERPNLPATVTVVFRRSSLKILHTFSTFYVCVTIWGATESW